MDALKQLFRRIECMVFGHQYRVLRRMNPGARKVGCDRCGSAWSMHDATKSFITWDEELEAFYAPGDPMVPPLPETAARKKWHMSNHLGKV